MEKYIHIILENGAQAAVVKSHEEDKRQGLRDRIIEFVEDLSIGPIDTYESDKKPRETWLKEILKVRVPDYDFTIDETLANLTRPLEAIDLAAKVVVWHGKSAKELINLAYIVSCFKDYEVYDADITNHIQLVEEEKVYYMTKLMQCSKQQLRETLDTLKPMTQDQKILLTEKWEMYKSLEGEIRVIENEQLVGKSIHYYDESILKQFEKELDEEVEKQVDEVVGAVRLEIEEMCGDFPSKLFLEYRIKGLMEEGKLALVEDHPSVAKVVIKKAAN